MLPFIGNQAASAAISAPTPKEDPLMSKIRSIVEDIMSKKSGPSHDAEDMYCMCKGCTSQGMSEGGEVFEGSDDFLSQDADRQAFPEESYDMDSGDDDMLPESDNKKRLGNIFAKIQSKHMGRK